MTLEEARELVRGLSGSHFAPEVVAPFLRVLDRSANRGVAVAGAMRAGALPLQP
jgi:response regulator RpfG family c-di-GMP phosphodiesterase